jgi:hypothetical protein
MKPMFIALAVAVGLMALASLIYLGTGRATGGVDAVKILHAAQAYTRAIHSQGAQVPQSVDLQELIARGLLEPGDVRGFAGAEVTISLIANPRNPRDVLLRMRLADGHELAALIDGSVIQTK